MSGWLHPSSVNSWRWLALTVWIVAFSVLVGVLLNQIHDQSVKARALAVQNKVTNMKQQQVLVMLCNRGYIILGLIEVSEDVVNAQMKHDIVANPKLAQAESAFLQLFQVAHGELIDELIEKESPCVQVAR